MQTNGICKQMALNIQKIPAIICLLLFFVVDLDGYTNFIWNKLPDFKKNIDDNCVEIHSHEEDESTPQSHATENVAEPCIKASFNPLK